jgi:hypothetical protein
MVRVLIVSKTHMSSGVCVGGLTRDTNRNIRLIPIGRLNQPNDTKFDVGQVWDIDFYNSPHVTPPHIEDVIVTREQYVAQVSNIRDILLQRIQPWRGGAEKLFDGCLTIKQWRGYISEYSKVPNGSVGFWIPDKPLVLAYSPINSKPHYRIDFEVEEEPHVYRKGKLSIPYVGFADPIPEIPAQALVRVSLPRWWNGEGRHEPRCYLQLSGWYL